MADVLSQSEMESLLAAPAVGGSPERESRLFGSQAARLPARIRPELLRGLRSVHEACAREASMALGKLVRTSVDVRLLTIERLSCAELISGLENPACCHLVQVEPLTGPLLFDLSPAIGYALVDRLLGSADIRSAAEQRRPPTEVERALLARVVDCAVQAHRTAWAGIADLRPGAVQAATTVQVAAFAVPEESVVLICLEMAMAGVQGALNICLPERALAAVAARLTDPILGKSGEGLSAKRAHRGAPSAGGALELVVHLASTQLRLDEVAGLAVGDVIVTDWPRTRPAEVWIGGRAKHLGFCGQLQGQKAVRIGPVLPGATPANDEGPAPA